MGQYGGDARWDEWLAFTNAAAAQPAVVTPTVPATATPYVAVPVAQPAVVQISRRESFHRKMQRTVRNIRISEGDEYYCVAPGGAVQTRIVTERAYAIPPTVEEVLGEPVAGSVTGAPQGKPSLSEEKDASLGYNEHPVDVPSVAVHTNAGPWASSAAPPAMHDTFISASPTSYAAVQAAPPPPPPPPPPPISPAYSSIPRRSPPPNPFASPTDTERVTSPMRAFPFSRGTEASPSPPKFGSPAPPTPPSVSTTTPYATANAQAAARSPPPVRPKPPPGVLDQLVHEAECRREEGAIAEALWRERQISPDRLRQENEDYGLLLAEERARRFRQGRLSIEEEERDRQLAERLQEEFNREAAAQASHF